MESLLLGYDCNAKCVILNDVQHSSLCHIFNRLPFSFVTDDVVQATCQCLLAQAADAENVSSICFVTFEILYTITADLLDEQKSLWALALFLLLQEVI